VVSERSDHRVTVVKIVVRWVVSRHRVRGGRCGDVGQAGGRLVEEQDLGITQQRPGKKRCAEPAPVAVKASEGRWRVA